MWYQSRKENVAPPMAAEPIAPPLAASETTVSEQTVSEQTVSEHVIAEQSAAECEAAAGSPTRRRQAARRYGGAGKRAAWKWRSRRRERQRIERQRTRRERTVGERTVGERTVGERTLGKPTLGKRTRHRHPEYLRRHCRLEQLESRQMLAVNVIEPLGQLDTLEDGHDETIDLRHVFQSDVDQPLVYQVEGDGHQELVDASVEEWMLRLQPLPERGGTAEITVRAVGQWDGQQAVDTLTLNVAPVNDPPNLVHPLPELTLAEGDAATIDLTEYFSDVEQDAASLRYSVAPFEVSYPGNPVATAVVADAHLTLQTASDRFGYAKYAVRAVDDAGAEVATTLYVFVDPVNDAPTAIPMPDRYYSLPATEKAPLVAIDLWHQNDYDGVVDRYFWDAEDECFLDYSVSVDNRHAFAVEPYVDDNDFLLYRPTVEAGFQGAALVTVTARDREGLEARLPDGSVPSFRVYVSNVGSSSYASSTDDYAAPASPDAATTPVGSTPATDSDPSTALPRDFYWPDLPQLPAAFPPIDASDARLPQPNPPIGESPVPGSGDPLVPYPGNPYPSDPYPGDPYPGDPYPGDPYPGDPVPPPLPEPYPKLPDPYPGEPYPPPTTEPYPEPPAPQPPVYPVPYPELPTPQPPEDPVPYPELPVPQPPVDPPIDPPAPSPQPPPSPPPTEGPVPPPETGEPIDPIPGVPDPELPDPELPDPEVPDPEVPDPGAPAPDPGDPTPPPTDPGDDPPADPPSDPPSDPPADPPADPPVPVPQPEILLDLDVLRHRVPDALEQSAGVLVALNNDYDELNLTTETIFVGPQQRSVTVLKRVPDNQPDRMPESGRQHRVAAPWDLDWSIDEEGVYWKANIDSDVRTAVVTASVAGSVSFALPDNALLWVPAWALYGSDAFTGVAGWRDGVTRWIPVREGERYEIDSYSGSAFVPIASCALPLAIEGMETGSSAIVASLISSDGRRVADDTVAIHVVAVDLDIDSDNSNDLQAPDRTPAEEQLEDAYRDAGKRLAVNSDDVDRDGIADFLDGFDLDGSLEPTLGTHADDNQVGEDKQLGFVPLVIDLPSPIDPAKALLRFVYSSSDPLGATIQDDGSRQVAPGGLRLWTVDEMHQRNARAVNDLITPGHFVAPQEVGGVSRHYSVAQLNGGQDTHQFTLYLEGVQAGKHGLTVEVDPDGIPNLVEDGGGNLVPQYPDLFDGFAMHDFVQVTVESPVTISAINAIGAETDSLGAPDPGSFLVRRNTADASDGLTVYYRVSSQDPHAGAIDSAANPARGDYDVIDSSGTTAGLADDPFTQIGSVYIPPGATSASLTVVPRDDRVVEWDEFVTIELITWDEYRELHDQPFVVTPNDGLPTSYNAWSWWEARSPYRLEMDERGEPVRHIATVTLLDNDHVENHSYQQADQESTGLIADSVGYGALQVDIHGGQARYELPLFAPLYREDDNLRPIAQTVVRLPANVVDATSLSGVYTVGGITGQVVEFEVTDLRAYLEPNAQRELRLVISGPDALHASLATGHYDHDIQLQAEIQGRSVTRTLRGSTDVINRVDELLGAAEWGSRWTLEELDRLVPSDGTHAGGIGTPVSRLTALGAAAEAGLALVRGDNSVSWFRAEAFEPSSVVEMSAADDPALQLSQAHRWIGHTNDDRQYYRTTTAGLHNEVEEVSWSFSNLTPGKMVQAYVQWDPDPTLASNAAYYVSAEPVTGRAGPILVDQRYVPGETEWDERVWHSLGYFLVPPDRNSLEVRLTTQIDDSTYVDGVVSAGAVMLVDCWDFTSPASSFSTLQWPTDGQPAQVTTKTDDLYEFDPASGVVTEVQDRNGNRTRYHYVDADNDGRLDELERIQRQGGLETTIQYAGQHVAGITDFAGRHVQWQIVNGGVTQVTLPDPGFGMQQPVYRFAYGSVDQLMVDATDPRGHSRHIDRREDSGRVAKVTNPDGHQWTIESYVEDGLDGQLRQPATGSLVGTELAAGALAQPWARFIDTRGGVWQYQTDQYALLTAHAPPRLPGSGAQDVWRWERDGRGLATRIIAPPGGGGDTPLPAIATRQQFDARGNLVQRLFADGTSETWTFDSANSQVETYQDRLGREIAYSLNARGNVVVQTEYEQHYADTPDRRTVYAHTRPPASMNDIPGGLLTEEVVAAGSPDAVTTITEYYESGPEIGLPATVRYAEGVADPDVASVVQFRYDQHRRLTEQIDEAGHSTLFVYDRLDRLHQQLDPLPGTGAHGPPTTTFFYDVMGNPSAIINARGATTVQQFDAMGRMISQTAPIAGGHVVSDQRPATTSHLYDGEGNLVAQWDAEGNQTSYKYDARNQLVALAQPTSKLATVPVPPSVLQTESVTTYSYDAWGNLLATRDPLGATVSNQYDLFQQLVRITYPAPGTLQHEAPVTHFVYDAAGQLLESRVQDSNSWRVDRYEYDDLGRLRREQRPSDNAGQSPVTVFAYDLRDNLVSEAKAEGRVTSYHYDQRDRLVLMALPDPDGAGPLGVPTTQYEYNVDGSLRASSFFNTSDPATAVVTRYQYDALGRVIHEVTSDPDGSGPLSAPEAFFSYDIMGNRTGEMEWVTPHDATNRRFFYDNQDRLWKTVEFKEGQPVSELIQSYDRVGNVVQRLERVGDDDGTTVYRQTNFTFDALGRVVVRTDPMPLDDEAPPTTHFYYDAVGNLRFQRNAAGTWTEHQFDALGRMVSVIESGTEDHASPVTTLEYTVAGELAAIVDPLGRRTEFDYDGLGRLLAKRLPAAHGSSNGPQPVERYEYDLFGNRVSVLDADGNLQTASYDALDRPVLLTENGAITRRLYDSLGRLAAETDPSGATTRYGYDLLGRRTAVFPPLPDGREPKSHTLDDTQAEFTGAWQVGAEGWLGTHRYAELADDAVADDAVATARWTMPDLDPGATYQVFATWKPDANNIDQARFRLLADEVMLVEPVVVDQRQIVADVVDGNQAWQRLAMVTLVDDTLDVVLDAPSANGNLVADGIWIVEVSGNTYTSYDGRGNVLTESDALGGTRKYTYDERSNRTSATDANGDTTRFAFDALGRVESVTDPLGNVTGYAYDHRDRVLAEWIETDGQLAGTQYQYDAMGNLQQVVDRLGRVRVMQYDVLGRLTDEMWYATAADAVVDAHRLNTIERTYDAAGRLTALSDDASRFEFLADDLDRPLLTTVATGVAPPIALRYEYARQDDLRAALYVSINGREDYETRYTYDSRSRLQRVEQSGVDTEAKRVDFVYTAADQLSEVWRYLGLAGSDLVVQSQYEYDSQGRLTTLIHRQSDNLLADYEWVFDAANRVVQQTGLRSGVAQFQYDARGQLLSAEFDDQADRSLQYDENGNRTGARYVVGDRNLLESDGQYQYEYDAQGNRTRRVEIATGKITRYQWDVMNRLVVIEELEGDEELVSRRVEYTYDALGRRIGKTITPVVGPAEVESFVYDEQDIVLRFTAGNLANRYLHGPLVDQVLADEQVGGDGRIDRVLWPLPDHLGTVNDLVEFDAVNALSSVANHITYGAFGEIANETAAAVDHLFGFTGRETDAESDLYYYRARYYDPQIGQFISEDPAGFAAGDVNLRRYVENDPTNQVDPTGLYGDDVHFYFNYYLARYLGLDQPSGWINSNNQPVSEAYIIAYFATRVDYDGVTQPVGNGVGGRTRFHFPDPGGPSKRVVRDDPRVRAALNTVGSTGDVEMFGLLLHVYQDSFAHESLNATAGHAFGAGPDQPYLHAARDRRMAQRVYDEMVNVLLVRRGAVDGVNSPEARALLRGKSFAAFWLQVQAVMLQKPRDIKGSSPSENRVLCWQQLIAKDFANARPRFNNRQGRTTNPLARRFRSVAEHVPVWYGKSYSHSQSWGNWRPIRPDGPPPWRTKDMPKTRTEINPLWYPEYGHPKF